MTAAVFPTLRGVGGPSGGIGGPAAVSIAGGVTPPAAGLKLYNALDYGIRADGATDDYDSTLALIDFIDTTGQGGRLWVPPGRVLYTTREIQLRADNLVFEATGATILGPVAGTDYGTLLAVVDRRNLARQIVGSGAWGGVYKPRNVADNGAAIVSGRRIGFNRMTVDLSVVGLRGIVVQTNQTFTGGAGTPVKDATISECFVFGGGTNSLDIESAGADNLIDGVIVEGCIFRDASTMIRIAGGGVAQRIYGIQLNNIKAVGSGAQATFGMTISRCDDIIVSDASFRNIRGGGSNGIDAQALRHARFSDIYVHSQTLSSFGIAFDDLAGFGNDVRLEGFEIDSDIALPGWAGGVYVAHDDVTVHGGSIRRATNGLVTNAGYATIYRDVEFEECTNLVNAFRTGDTYQRLVLRTPSVETIVAHDDNEVTPAALGAANNNDYNPGGATVLRLTANAAGSVLTGMTKGYATRRIRIINLTANALTIANQDVNSAAANRFLSPTGANIVMGIDDMVDVYYDVTSLRWRVSNVQL